MEEGYRELRSLVGAGIWREWGVEEVLLQRGSNGGQGLLARWGSDDSNEMEFGDGGSRDVDALGVGACIGRSQEEASVADEVVKQGGVDGSQAFKQVFGTVRSAEDEAQPKALGTGSSEKGAAGKPFGVERVGQIEVADVADVLYIIE